MVERKRGQGPRCLFLQPPNAQFHLSGKYFPDLLPTVYLSAKWEELLEAKWPKPLGKLRPTETDPCITEAVTLKSAMRPQTFSLSRIHALHPTSCMTKEAQVPDGPPPPPSTGPIPCISRQLLDRGQAILLTLSQRDLSQR